MSDTYIHMLALDTSHWLLYLFECEGAFQRHFDRFLHRNELVVAILCLEFAQQAVNHPLTCLYADHRILDRVENVVFAISLVYLDSK